MKNSIYLILGLCGAGKTTLIKNIQEHGELRAFDFDDIGVPDTPTHQWRIDSTEIWLKKLASLNDSCVLAGFMYPAEIINAKNYSLIKDRIKILYLRQDLGVISERLKNRGWKSQQIEWTLKQEQVIIGELEFIEHTIIDM